MMVAPVVHASDIVTIMLLVALEGLLSADNAMVLAVLVLGLPKAQQRKALRYGIVGAFAFRSAATVLAALLIRLGWGKLFGAGYLLYLGYRHFGRHRKSQGRRTSKQRRRGVGAKPFCSLLLTGRRLYP